MQKWYLGDREIWYELYRKSQIRIRKVLISRMLVDPNSLIFSKIMVWYGGCPIKYLHFSSVAWHLQRFINVCLIWVKARLHKTLIEEQNKGLVSILHIEVDVSVIPRYIVSSTDVVVIFIKSISHFHMKWKQYIDLRSMLEVFILEPGPSEFCSPLKMHPFSRKEIYFLK